jgi:branched-chain amino acid transport system permease protein
VSAAGASLTLPLRAERVRGGLLVLLVLVLLALPLALAGRPFELRLLTVMFLYAAMGQSWNLLAGYAGQTSLGHGMFFGIGAYTSTLAGIGIGLNPWLGGLLGSAAAAVVGIVLGLVCFRLKGHYFVIATLVIAESLNLAFADWEWVGGAMGLQLPIEEPSLLTFQFHRDKLPYYYIALLLLAFATALVVWLDRRKTGHVLRAIRDDEEATRSLGFSPMRYKLLAMALSAALIAFCGTFYAQFVLFIDPPSVLSLQLSVMIALVGIVGGIGTPSGPIVGAAVLVTISEYARIWFSGGGRSLDLMIYGLIIMLVAIYRPAGIVSFFGKRGGKAPA